MNTADVVTLPISEEDEAVLRKLQEKAWFTFLRLYGSLFLCLVYLYFRVQPSGLFSGNYFGYRGKLTAAGYALVFACVVTLFGVIFLIFAVKDYMRLIIPFQRELKQRTKRCIVFKARKYLDPVYGHCLLFYPDKEDIYIEVNKDDFESIGNGEDLKLEVAVVTGEVLALRSALRDFYKPEEFSFSDR